MCKNNVFTLFDQKHHTPRTRALYEKIGTVVIAVAKAQVVNSAIAPVDVNAASREDLASLATCQSMIPSALAPSLKRVKDVTAALRDTVDAVTPFGDSQKESKELAEQVLRNAALFLSESASAACSLLGPAADSLLTFIVGEFTMDWNGFWHDCEKRDTSKIQGLIKHPHRRNCQAYVGFLKVSGTDCFLHLVSVVGYEKPASFQALASQDIHTFVNYFQADKPREPLQQLATIAASAAWTVARQGTAAMVASYIKKVMKVTNQKEKESLIADCHMALF